jgi:hypothetical protein
MNSQSAVRLAVPLVALVAIGPMALAQQTGQQGGMGGCPMMSQGTMGGPMMGGMMGQGRQGRQGMMGPGMMGPGMSQDGGKASGMTGMFGSRMTPVMNLSVEDVRGHLAAQLDRLNNRRLKVGDVKADTGTITAEVVTVDNSLVQRLKVDRRTGAIDYQE